MLEYLKLKKREALDFFSSLKSRVLKSISKACAHLWHHFLWSKYYVQTGFSKYKWKIVWTSILVFVGLNIAFLSKIDPLLSMHFPDPNSISNLETVLTTLGGALIGAAFIAFSLIMFSMQVNIERMPHGLFFRFGKDAFILLMFVATLVSGIVVCFSSTLLHDPANLSASISLAFWGTITIITFVIQAYERTLFLINPAEQLNTLLASVEKDLKSWERRAEMAKPLLEGGDSEEQEEDTSFMSTHDIKKSVYMQLNPHGKQLAKNAIDHAFSFSRRYAGRGDYVVSAHAMQVIGMINRLYVQHKGKTFYSDHPWLENPFSSDDLVTYSLESLRRSMIVALSRKDEQQVIQILQTFALLANIYLQIDYSNEHASKTHANLAASYLSEAVVSVFPHDMTDVVMEGLRLMGQHASLSCQVGKVTDAVPLIDKIGVVTAAGIANKKYYPVIMTGMQQLARLTMVLLQSKPHDLSFTFKTIKRNVSFVSETFLKIPSGPLEQIHGSYLGPYYSYQQSNLRPMMGDLANRVMQADKDSKDAKEVIRNFVTWSDQIYDPERKLLQVALKSETDFLFHIIDWTKSVSEILIALSNAPACDDHSKKQLQRNASWLISNLSFVPDDKESVSAVANHQLHETLFEAAMTGYQRECSEYIKAARDCLLGWAFKGGKYQLGWGILEHSLCGLAALALLPDQISAVEKLKRDTQNMLLKESIPQEMLDRTARDMREQAATLHRLREYPHSVIETVMKQIDATEMQSLLEDLANLLSPDTAGEEVNVSYF
jgi:hypothetical protein